MNIKFNNSIEFSRSGYKFGSVAFPVTIEGFDKASLSVERVELPYNSVVKNESGFVCSTELSDEKFGHVRVCDQYNCTSDYIDINRTLEIFQSGSLDGIRLRYEMDLDRGKNKYFEDFRYFAPPAVYDKNDLDDDGLEDYFHTQKIIFRDDRFNYPAFMAYDEKAGKAIRIERNPLPAFDSEPIREKRNGEKVALFVQKTDIGSMGVDGDGHNPVKLVNCYPFDEGDATIALYIIKTVPFGAFWPLVRGESFSFGFRLKCDDYSDYHEAWWGSIVDALHTHNPEPAPLYADIEKIVENRISVLDRYYIEKTAEEDVNMPAGYVLNCHPQIGTQLENIIQYGFTGQNVLNALNVLRYGYENNQPEYIRKGRRIADFFADVIHIKDTGMFYNLYNTDMKRVNFWWTGLLLPLAYAQGDELEELMGPLYEYRKEIIDVLIKKEGAYLRCMNEDAIALLRLYLYEKDKGVEHANWKEAVTNYGEFLLKTQDTDGGWYRAYDLKGKAILDPEIWFGATVYEKKSSTGTSISLLVELYNFTKDERYLKAAQRAGEFVITNIIEKVKFNGGVHDSIYAKGQLVDNESILYPMFGVLSLYECTKDPKYLKAAHLAARQYASWACLWNVPLPPASTLAKYGFNSIGMGACDTCGCGYVHPFQLMGVAELAQIAIYTEDKELFKLAELYWYGCNQTVQLPEKDWGYAYDGLQEEGYLVSWWAVDDPMFSPETGFGNRNKGEGNKTCFSWINAVGVKGYWSLIDRFGTTDFELIREKYFGGPQ